VDKWVSNKIISGGQWTSNIITILIVLEVGFVESKYCSQC
jgi:hypothetical protein